MEHKNGSTINFQTERHLTWECAYLCFTREIHYYYLYSSLKKERRRIQNKGSINPFWPSSSVFYSNIQTDDRKQKKDSSSSFWKVKSLWCWRLDTQVIRLDLIIKMEFNVNSDKYKLFVCVCVGLCCRYDNNMWWWRRRQIG